MKSFVIQAVIFGGVVFFLQFYFFNLPLVGMITRSVIAGVTFALLLKQFVSSKTVQQQTNVEVSENDNLIRTAPANHLYKGDSAGGKLYLFKDRLHFKSHQMNMNNHEMVIDIQDIRNASLFNFLFIIPTGLKVTTRNGKKEKFVVENRKQWMEDINRLTN